MIPVPPVLRVSRIHYPVHALGYGKRLGVWVQGCPLACHGCIARDTWDANDGFLYSVPDLARLCRQSLMDGADGVTISGGEPLEQPGPVAALLTAVHEMRADAGRDFDIMLFTGYELSELDGGGRATAAGLADVLITGRYLAGRPTRLIWRGSANQRMHLQTPLARERYESYVDLEPERTPIQLAAEDDGVWMVGVPTAGSLRAIEKSLAAQGIAVESASWRRPPHRR